MSLQSGYILSRLNVQYASKLRYDLTESIERLKKTIDLAGYSGSYESKYPTPRRLQRRAWRVFYNKAPHAIGWSKRHYVFHDWRYEFEFRGVSDVRYIPKHRF